jgi:hypothetical protein
VVIWLGFEITRNSFSLVSFFFKVHGTRGSVILRILKQSELVVIYAIYITMHTQDWNQPVLGSYRKQELTELRLSGISFLFYCPGIS